MSFELLLRTLHSYLFRCKKYQSRCQERNLQESPFKMYGILFIYFKIPKACIPMMNCTSWCMEQICGMTAAKRSMPFLYTSLLTITMFTGGKNTVSLNLCRRNFMHKNTHTKINLMHNCQIITNHKYFSANQPLSHGFDKNTGLIRLTWKINCRKPVYIL